MRLTRRTTTDEEDYSPASTAICMPPHCCGSLGYTWVIHSKTTGIHRPCAAAHSSSVWILPCGPKRAFGPNCSLFGKVLGPPQKSTCRCQVATLKGAIAFNCAGVEWVGAVYMTPTAINPSAVRL